MLLLPSLLLPLLATVPGHDETTPAPGLPVTFLPRAVTSFGCDVSGGWLYVLGGFHGRPHDYTPEGQSDDFYRICLADPRVVEDLPGVGRVQSVGLAAHEGRLYRVGGMLALEAEDGWADLVSSTEVQVFDPAEGTWSDLPHLPEPRSSHDVAVIGGQLFVAGGWDVAGDDRDRQWSEHVFALDLTDPGADWRRIPSPVQTRALGVAGTDRHLVLIGGIAPDRSTDGEVFALDVEAEEWSEGPAYPGEAFGPAARGVDGRVYANGMDGGLFSWAVGEESWRDEGVSLTQARFFHQLVTDGRDLYAVGGITGMERRGRIRAIERFDLSGGDEVHVRSFAVPFPGDALTKTAALLKGETIYVFGGHVSPRDHDFSPEAFGEECWSLNLNDLGWDRRASTPAPRQSMRLAEAPSGLSLIAVGGVGHDGEQGKTMEAVWAYARKADTWQASGCLGVGRTQVGLAWSGEELLVLGGMVFDPRSDHLFDYPTEVLSWRRGAEHCADTGLRLPRARRSFAGVSHGGSYYLVGGMETDGAPVDGGDVLDLESRTWSEIPAPSATRHSAHLLPLHGRLLLVGGRAYDEQEYEWDSARSIEAYDPQAGAWTTVVEDVGFDADDAHAFVVGDRLLILRLADRAAHLTYVSVPR